MLGLTIIIGIGMLCVLLVFLITYFNEVLTYHQLLHDESDHTEMAWVMLAIFIITWLIIGMFGWLIVQL